MLNRSRREERRIRRLLANIERKQNDLMADITRLNAAVAANTAAVEAAVAKISAAPAASSPSQEELDATAAQVESNNAALDAAAPPVV